MKICYFGLGLVLGVLIGTPCHARDGADFASSAEVHEWFENLKQPDNKRLSCCSDADAYWADSFEVNERGEYVAIITDERGQTYDEKVGRVPRSAGDRFDVPNYKIKYDKGNPTGHGVLFLATGGQVLCFVPGGGV